MSLQQKIYHEKIYQNLAMATLQRNQQLQQQQLLHSELMAHYQHEIFRNQIDQRRLQFRHFVAEKLQQERLQRGIDEEHFHQEYLERIDKLRKQRQRLGAHSLQPLSHHYTYIQENDHSLLCEGLANQSNSNKKKVFIKEQSNPIDQSKNNRQYLKQSIDPEINGRLFYNSALVDKLQNRWIPYDQRTNHESSKKQEEQQYIERHLDKLNELHQSIKNTKVPNLSNASSVSVSQELSKKDDPNESANKPGNVMVGQPRTNKSLIVNKKPILIEEQDEKSGRNEQKICSHNKKKKAHSLMKNNKENRLNFSSVADPKPYYMDIEAKKNQKVEYKGIMGRIKNRLELSSVVYEDSQHRNILHQKNHLMNKYQTQCKMRKEMIIRICNSKDVRQKYKNVGLAVANQN